MANNAVVVAEKIAAALLSAAAEWKPTDNVADDIADITTIVTAAGAAGLSLPQAELAAVTATAAGESNLKNGQIAQVAAIPASFDGVKDIIDIYAIRRSAGEVVKSGDA